MAQLPSDSPVFRRASIGHVTQMEGIQELLNKREHEAVTYGDGQNHVQALYFDLLSCLGQGDHPDLPQSHEQKPMTGFLDIIEAFNDFTKLHSAGSGIVVEIGSKEFVEEGVLTSASVETFAASKSAESSTNVESFKSFLCDDDCQRESSATSNQTSEPNQSPNALREYQLNSAASDVEPDNEFASEQLDHPSKNIVESFDENENWKVDTTLETSSEEKVENLSSDLSIITPEKLTRTEEQHELQTESHHDDVEYANPDYVQEVGPSLDLSDPSAHNQEISAMEKEMLKYSEELKEIEKMLKQHLNAPLEPWNRSSSSTHTNATENTHAPNSLTSNMVHTLADGLMSPSRALEMMYNMESTGSPYNLSPRETRSTYASCTSFPNWQGTQPAQESCSQTCQTPTVSKSPSVYMQCLNLNETGSIDCTQFTCSLDSLNTQSTANKASEKIEKHKDENISKPLKSSEFENYMDFSHLLAQMVKNIAMEDGDENSTEIVDKNSESLDNAIISKLDTQESVDTEEKPSKDKKAETHFDDKSPVSSEDERLWTSASGSDSEYFEDVDDGTTTSKD